MIRPLLLIFLFKFTTAFYINTQYSVILTRDNFNDGVSDGSIFVLFIEDPERRTSFLDLWEEVGEVAKAEETTRTLRFGIVDCSENKDFCNEKGISEKIQLKFYGERNYWSNLETFLRSTIDDVLREDELIARLSMPGNLFVLFKVVYCPYCKEAMDEFLAVQEHFKKYPNLFVGSLDCTRHREICKKFDALKWPRFKFIHNDNTQVTLADIYDGERKAKDMIDYVESMNRQYK